MLSQIKDRKHIEQNYHSVAESCARVLGGGSKTSVGICDGAPSTAPSSELLLFEEKSQICREIMEI